MKRAVLFALLLVAFIFAMPAAGAQSRDPRFGQMTASDAILTNDYPPSHLARGEEVVVVGVRELSAVQEPFFRSIPTDAEVTTQVTYGRPEFEFRRTLTQFDNGVRWQAYRAWRGEGIGGDFGITPRSNSFGRLVCQYRIFLQCE